MSQRIPLTIVSRDKRLAYDLIEPDENRMATGMSNEIADDTKIVYKGALVQKGLDTPPAADFILYALEGSEDWLFG